MQVEREERRACEERERVCVCVIRMERIQLEGQIRETTGHRERKRKGGGGGAREKEIDRG